MGGGRLNSLDLRRFLPLLHSQALRNGILTGEKSPKARIFPTQFQSAASLEAGNGSVFPKMESWLAAPAPLTHKE